MRFLQMSAPAPLGSGLTDPTAVTRLTLRTSTGSFIQRREV
jgi:hypothetical protein